MSKVQAIEANGTLYPILDKETYDDLINHEEKYDELKERVDNHDEELETLANDVDALQGAIGDWQIVSTQEEFDSVIAGLNTSKNVILTAGEYVVSSQTNIQSAKIEYIKGVGNPTIKVNFKGSDSGGWMVQPNGSDSKLVKLENVTVEAIGSSINSTQMLIGFDCENVIMKPLLNKVNSAALNLGKIKNCTVYSDGGLPFPNLRSVEGNLDVYLYNQTRDIEIVGADKIIGATIKVTSASGEILTDSWKVTVCKSSYVMNTSVSVDYKIANNSKDITILKNCKSQNMKIGFSLQTNNSRFVYGGYLIGGYFGGANSNSNQYLCENCEVLQAVEVGDCTGTFAYKCKSVVDCWQGMSPVSLIKATQECLNVRHNRFNKSASGYAMSYSGNTEESAYACNNTLNGGWNK